MSGASWIAPAVDLLEEPATAPVDAVEPSLPPDPEDRQPRFTASPSGRLVSIASGFLLLWILSGVYIVRADQQAVVTRFGAVVDPRILPGIHLSLPWPVDRITKLKVQQLQRLVIGGESADAVTGRSQPLQAQFLTGDQNIISMRVVVQYSVGTPTDYLFRNENVVRSVSAAVETTLAQRIAARTVDAVLTTEKQSIQDDVLAAAQQLINAYQTGVILSTVNIEQAVPPPETADSFRDVANARADSARIVSEAQGYANDLIPKARGQAQQMIESADGYREKKINEADGDAARFTQIAAEYASAPAVNARRLYLEAMEQILPKIRKLIVDKNGNLDLTIIRKGEPTKQP